MIRKTEQLIIGQMEQAAADMEEYDRLYRAFRKIRHDFANYIQSSQFESEDDSFILRLNYIQSSQFESEDDSFILRLRMLKKDTLKLTNDLLAELRGYLDEEGELIHDGSISYLQKETAPPSYRLNERERILYDLWEDMKEYFRCQLFELKRIREVLLHLQDRLERSLPPDEEESRIHIEECDSIRYHMTADHVLIAAYAFRFRESCQKLGAQFRFQICIPPVMEERWGDFFYLLGVSKEAAELWLSGINDAGRGAMDTEPMVRIRSAVGMGLWHFSLEYGWQDEGPVEEVKNLENDKTLKKLLRKSGATLRRKQEINCYRVDITG